MKLLVGLDALLISNALNIRYLTGFIGAAPNERETFLLILKNKAFLLVNSLYEEQAKDPQLLKNKTAFQIRTFSHEKLISKILLGICTKEKILRLGYEAANLTVAEFGKLKKSLNGLHLIPTYNRVESLRMIKRDDELAFIRKAAKLTDRCFDSLIDRIKPGVTETTLVWEIESFFRTHGATPAFSPIVAFGKNSSQPHYQGTSEKGPFDQTQGGHETRLQKNDIVLLDFGARVGGYCADMTRVVFIGKPTNEWKRAYQTVLSAQMNALDYLNSAPEPFGAHADRIARTIIKGDGYAAYPHSLGHAVGLAIHEAPRLTIRKDTILLPGMVVTVEPAIYSEGRYGIRIEDLVCLKKRGIEILTRSPKILMSV